MKESSMKNARETWIDTYEDEEYYELLRECYGKSKVPKEQGQKRHKWRCIYCEEVFRCRPSLNYHRYKVCPTVGHCLKQYPIVGKGQRIVMKDQQAIVKGQLGKCKGHMASVEEDGMPHTIRDRLEVDNLHQFPRDTQTHQAPVMSTPNISNVLLEERGVSSSSERGPGWNLGMFEVTETVDTSGLGMGSENHEHVEVEGDGEGHALEVEDEEWGWSPLFCLLRDFPKLRPPDFPPRPWKHTIEELDVIQKFLIDRKAHRTKPSRPPLIVLALKATWHFHFGNGSSIMEHYSKLEEKLEDVSKDKEFVNNLSRMQHLMRTECGSMTGYAKILFLTIQDPYADDGQPTLEDDVSSFTATSEICEHKEVIKRVVDWLIGTCCVLEDLCWSFYLEDMWHSPRKYEKNIISHETKLWESDCKFKENYYTGFTLEDLQYCESSPSLIYNGFMKIMARVAE
ncbi:unnamed protein product [Sphagnum jensenii]|uniref:C2H2-type domain-containing protein n=1 Tax=Sphagnum jensenii TaxID=128206 RepID=A0ABP1B9I4_9BRYO